MGSNPLPVAAPHIVPAYVEFACPSSFLPHNAKQIMILGIGTDIIETARIRASVERFGEHFLTRILLPAELTYCQSFRDPSQPVAARFAAKEAISKAFGTGIGAQLSWLDMEILRSESGEPRVQLHGAGRNLFESQKARQLRISLSHTANYAVAVAILED